jgi:ribosome-binding protein aMBF1 (putative translation factor)
MAIIKELRDELTRRPESYRQIARAIEIDHSLLLRFADGKKNLGSQTAEKLADYLGMRLVKKN